MAVQPGNFALIYDPENGFQLMDLTTQEVADLAVLEGTWRKPGSQPTASGQSPAKPRVEPAPGRQPDFVQKMTTLQYGGLRIRSTGTSIYAIADPRVSLRDATSPQP